MADAGGGAGPERGGRRLAGGRHRRQHGGVLVVADLRTGAAARRAAGGGVPPDRAAHRRRRQPRRLVARVPGPAHPAGRHRRSDGVPHGAAQRRRSRPHRAGVRAAGLRGVLPSPRPASRIRPAADTRRRGVARIGAGGGGVTPLLAIAPGRRSGRARPIGSRQRRRSDGGRRPARRLPGHRPRPAVRSVAAGDDGSGGARRLARTRGPAGARLFRHGPHRRPRQDRRGRTGGGAGDARPCRPVSGDQPRPRRRGPAGTGGRHAGRSGCSSRP